MKALTVQQPWAWAILHGGKLIENRTANWSYRGPLAIHAGMRFSDHGTSSPLVNDAFREHHPDGAAHNGGRVPHGAFVLGAFLGVVDLVDVHPDVGCCRPWGESAYDEHGGTTRNVVTHLVLDDPRPFQVPIPARGALGLWTPNPYDTTEIVRRAVL